MARTRLERQKGRRGGGGMPFAMMPVDVLQSPACATLPHVAHRVLVALAAQYTGHGNGSLSLTRRTAVTFGLGSSHTLGASLAELEARGLIVQTRLGTRIPPRSALFALGWLRIDEPQSDYPHELKSTLKPPDAWRRWVAAARGPHWTVTRRAERYRRCTSVSGAGALSDSRMSGAGAPKNPIFPVAQVHGSHISMGGGADGDVEPAAKQAAGAEVDPAFAPEPRAKSRAPSAGPSADANGTAAPSTPMSIEQFARTHGLKQRAAETKVQFRERATAAYLKDLAATAKRAKP